jgi:hypothetical protein
MIASQRTTTRLFGRRLNGFVHRQPGPAGPRVADDLRLFALTFAGGFLFMAVYLG